MVRELGIGRRTAHPARQGRAAAGPERCRRKLLRFFPRGFRDEKYVAWERSYKWEAHEHWKAELGRATHRTLLDEGSFAEVALRAVRIEARTNLLFSFEKMALRDAVRVPVGAQLFATGLYDFLHGAGGAEERFERWCAAVAALPRRQTRVLTWPLLTIFGFIAQPEAHVFLKPNATRRAAARYGFDFRYRSRPSWDTYASLLGFAAAVRRDLLATRRRDLAPRDMIDIQSFLWVAGSDEYD